MEKLKFFVPGKPIGKERPRHNFRTGACYTPKKTKIYESDVAMCAQKAMKEQNKEIVTEGGVLVDVIAFFEIPKSLSKKKREMLYLMPVTKKPDTDNVDKIVLDGMKSILYRDDAQVTFGVRGKFYEGPDHPVGVLVKARPHNEPYKDEDE